MFSAIFGFQFIVNSQISIYGYICANIIILENKNPKRIKFMLNVSEIIKKIVSQKFPKRFSIIIIILIVQKCFLTFPSGVGPFQFQKRENVGQIMFMCFLARKYPSILHPPAFGAGLLTFSTVLLCLPFKANL